MNGRICNYDIYNSPSVRSFFFFTFFTYIELNSNYSYLYFNQISSYENCWWCKLLYRFKFSNMFKKTPTMLKTQWLMKHPNLEICLAVCGAFVPCRDWLNVRSFLSLRDSMGNDLTQHYGQELWLRSESIFGVRSRMGGGGGVGLEQ